MFVLQRVVLRTRISKERPINTCVPYVPSFSGCGRLKETLNSENILIVHDDLNYVFLRDHLKSIVYGTRVNDA